MILREDSRSKNPPPFDAIKEQLRPLVERKKVQDYIAQLRKEAKVEIFTPSAEQQKSEPAQATAVEQPPREEGFVEEDIVVEEEPTADVEKPSGESIPATEETKKPATDTASSTDTDDSASSTQSTEKPGSQ